MTLQPTLLLHIAYPTNYLNRLDKLLDEFQVTLFFSQIGPRDSDSELCDKAGVIKAAEILKLKIIYPVVNEISKHRHDWRDDMPVCRDCWRRSIEQVASVAENDGYDYYSSLLYTNSDELTREEEEITGVGTSQFLSLIGYS